MTKTPNFFDFAKLNRDEIASLLHRHNIQLTVDEALHIQNELLHRPPSHAECILWSIQGSEHCSYKSTRRHLKKFNTEAPHVLLGPKEDAGIITVATDNSGLRYGIVVSHESHNHPSQLVPYEGAATGVGGNVRDVCCMGAEVIAVADSLRFGRAERPKTEWIKEGVVHGIAGYANPLGIPNLAGDVFYHPDYNENCLVTLVTLGLVREDHIIHSYAPENAEDYVFILVGKPTDNSGFGGAAFASANLQEERQHENKGAVQEPNAFLQRHLLKANYALFRILQEQKLIQRVGFKDLGAGGIACASVEMAQASGYGAQINLDLVPVSMAQLMPAVILCSETQERFMWVVPAHLAPMVLEHYNQRFALPEICAHARAAIVGHLTQDPYYHVSYQGETIVHAKASDITEGILYNRPYQKASKNFIKQDAAPSNDFNEVLLNLLKKENIRCSAEIYDHYDKQVQGRTFLERGQADAGVLTPFNEPKYPPEIQQTGVSLTVNHNPFYSEISAYWGAVNAVISAARSTVATGAWPYALTDCLCFGNPEDPAQMAEFVEAIQGIIDAAKAIHMLYDPQYTLPIISGNVSLYNQSAKGPIPPSPIISCIGVMPEVDKARPNYFQQAHSIIVLVGARLPECGGSQYYDLIGLEDSRVPQPSLSSIHQELVTVYNAIQQNYVSAAHSISRGGIAVALSEMCFHNNLGVEVSIQGELPSDQLLFAETGGFILEVTPGNLSNLSALFKEAQIPFIIIGETTTHPVININALIHLTTKNAYDVWSNL